MNGYDVPLAMSEMGFLANLYSIAAISINFHAINDEGQIIY